MIKTFKYRLVPTRKQQVALRHTLELCRNLYNVALEQRRMRRTHPIVQMREVTERKQEFSEYQGVHAHVLQNVIKKLGRSFENFFRRCKSGQKPRFPRFKSKDRFDSFAFNNTGFKLAGRVQRATMRAQQAGYGVRFPVKEQGVTKQQCADWCVSLGVQPPRMYRWSDHANCINCRRGGKAYAIESARQNPVEFAQLLAHEKNPVFQGHTIFKDGPLEQIVAAGLKRKVSRRESIDIGACECGG